MNDKYIGSILGLTTIIHGCHLVIVLSNGCHHGKDFPSPEDAANTARKLARNPTLEKLYAEMREVGLREI